MENVDSKSTEYIVQLQDPRGFYVSREKAISLERAQEIQMVWAREFPAIPRRIVRRETFVKETVVEESK